MPNNDDDDDVRHNGCKQLPSLSLNFLRIGEEPLGYHNKNENKSRVRRTLDGMDTTVDLDNTAASEVITEERRVDGCRHQNHVHVRKRLHHVTQQHQQKISLRTDTTTMTENDSKSHTLSRMCYHYITNPACYCSVVYSSVTLIHLAEIIVRCRLAKTIVWPKC